MAEPFITEEEWRQNLAEMEALQEGGGFAPGAPVEPAGPSGPSRYEAWAASPQPPEGQIDLPEVMIPADILAGTAKYAPGTVANESMQAAMVGQAEQMPWDVESAHTPMSVEEWSKMASNPSAMMEPTALENTIMDEESKLLHRLGLDRPEPKAYKDMSPEEQLNLIAFLQQAQEKKAQQAQENVMNSMPGGSAYDRDFMFGAGVLPLTEQSAQVPGNEAVLARELPRLEQLKQARMQSLIAAAEAVEKMGGEKE